MSFVPALFVRLFLCCILLSALFPGNGIASGQILNKKSKKLYEKSLAEYRQGNFSASERWILQSLRQDSSSVEAFLLLSDISFELKNTNQAIYALNKVINLGEERYPLAYKLLADACFFSAQYDSSLTFYQKYQTFRVNSDQPDLLQLPKGISGIPKLRC